MGFYYRSIGDDTTALQHFTAAVKLDKKYAPAYNNIGYSNLTLGRFADSERAFKTYITLIPKNPNPYDSYAELLMKTGKYDESIKQYNQALAIDPTFINSYRGIGNNYVYKGDFAKARESYKLMFDKASDDGLRDLALLSAMNSYLTEGNMDKALEVNEQRREIAEKLATAPRSSASTPPLDTSLLKQASWKTLPNISRCRPTQRRRFTIRNGQRE